MASRRMMTTAAIRTSLAAPIPAAHATMPPGLLASVRSIDTFTLPSRVTGTIVDQALASAMIRSWRRDGILQIAMSPAQRRAHHQAETISRAFFRRPPHQKRACVDPSSYSGYIASGEEMTGGVADYSEIFTVTKDLAAEDQRVKAGWPCHGPCPWPDGEMRGAVGRYMEELKGCGEVLLQLIEMGLGVAQGSLTRYTHDGWHHLRMLRFPARHNTNGKGKAGRGIGSHTDYGLLVIAAQDEVGGLCVRPPRLGEIHANWHHSAAGLREDDTGWVYIPPVPGTFTVFPGDMMQYMTRSYLPSTPHKVSLNTRERFAFAYFHEPNFRAVMRPLVSAATRQSPPPRHGARVASGDPSEEEEGIHYGTHFTNMFVRNYPERVTTRKLMGRKGQYEMLQTPELRDEMMGYDG